MTTLLMSFLLLYFCTLVILSLRLIYGVEFDFGITILMEAKMTVIVCLQTRIDTDNRVFHQIVCDVVVTKLIVVVFGQK